MLKSARQIVSILSFICLVLSGNLRAKLELSGELGVDLESYSFDRLFKDTLIDTNLVFDSISSDTVAVVDTTLPRSSYANRNISNHYMNINLQTPIVKEELASLSGRASIYGTYYDAKSNEDDGGLSRTDSYFSPDLHTYSGNLSIFPNRPYPLLLYVSKSFNRAVRFESNNRADTLQVAPGLQIIRRYDNEIHLRGLQWRLTPRENINFGTEYYQNETIISRVYDFKEDRNIWVEISAFRPDPTVNFHNISVINELDDSVDIFIDGLPTTSVGPAGTPGRFVQILLEAGEHFLEFIPHNGQRFNSYRRTVVVRSEQTWKISYNPPATPNDLSQTLTSFSATLNVEPSKKVKNETRYEYTTMDETVQQVVSFIGNFNNSFRYDLSRLNNIQMMTTYTKNRTQIDTLKPQINSSFMHQTTLTLAKRKGLATSFSHSLNVMASILSPRLGEAFASDDTLKSTTNIFTGRITFDVDRLNYTGDLKNTVTLLSDSLHYGLIPVDTILVDDDVTDSIPPDTLFRADVSNGYRSNQYISDFTSRFRLRLWRVDLQPAHQIKYSYGLQKNPNQNSSEWENKFILAGELVNFGFLDKLKFRGEYGHRIRITTSGQESFSKEDIKDRLLMDISLTQEIAENYRLMLLATLERETFGGSASTGGVSDGTIDAARQPQDKYSYKIDFQASPIENILLNAGYTQITQKTNYPLSNAELLRYTPNTIKRYSISLITNIPLVNIPLKSYLMSESRQLRSVVKDISGGHRVVADAAQIQTTLETKLTYRFRKIALTLKHTFRYENLRDEKYSYHEIRGKISRLISVF